MLFQFLLSAGFSCPFWVWLLNCSLYTRSRSWAGLVQGAAALPGRHWGRCWWFCRDGALGSSKALVLASLEMLPLVEYKNKVSSVAQWGGSAPAVGKVGCAHCLLDLGIWLSFPPLQLILGFTLLECEVPALLEHSETQHRLWVSPSPSPTVPGLIPRGSSVVAVFGMVPSPSSCPWCCSGAALVTGDDHCAW